MPDLQVPATTPAAATVPVGAAGAPTIADDGDLIEPEWVEAVKRTVLQYQQDPYSLAQALTELREDYLLKRYGRHIEQAQ